MCIKYLKSACFDQDTDNDTLGTYIESGAYVLIAYVFNHWLHHMGNVGRQDFLSLMSDIEHLIDTRANPSFEGRALESESQEDKYYQPLNSVEGKVNRMLNSARVFSKKRKRDLSLDDCKRGGPLNTHHLNPC